MKKQYRLHQELNLVFLNRLSWLPQTYKFQNLKKRFPDKRKIFLTA